MTPERWAEIDRVWHAVLARPEAERTAALTDLCGADRELRAEVEALLTSLAHASAAGFGAAPGIVNQHGSLVGRQLGSYTVHALLGIGGMGEVYQAHDSTLGREVALKILPDLWRSDPDRSARFDREARVLASLNHPNIGAIYGVHDSDSVKALVLELVEGETLADRIIRQPPSHRGLPIDEVTSIAGQIIDALEAAHERGIVHRDLKPGNIKITSDGRVKVLDFGLARAVSGGSSPALAHSPTITAVGTQHGMLLGTAAYMSPEQARGRTVDKRADIWAFGCVLFEMLTGASAFGGEGVTDLLANVINREPDWSALPTDTPAALRTCVKRCVQKDVHRRFHDIADVRLALEGAFDIPVTERERSGAARVVWMGWAAVLVAIGTAAGIALSFVRPPTRAAEVRLQIVTPPTSDPASIAISPDGRAIAFSGGRGRPLWIRRLESEEAAPLMNTTGATMPFWSPDNQSIGFFADGLLKRIDLGAGFVRTLASAPQPRRGTWNKAGTIVFGAGSVGPLYRVAADGGPVQEVTRLLPGQTNHRFPEFLPDGQRFLLFSLGSTDVRGVYVASLSDPIVRRISDRESAYAFLPPGHLLFARQGALWARALSPDDTSTVGDLVPVAPKVFVYMTATGFGAFATSASGSLAYRPSPGQDQLVWRDRTGRTVAALGQPDDNQLGLVHLSSDGRTAAVERMVDGNADLWLVDTERGALRRLTTDPAVDGDAIFSPDGNRVIYVTDGKADVFQIYERRADGTGNPTMVFESDENKNPHDWSPDGKYMLYSSQRVETNLDLMALPLFGERTPLEVARTPFRETDGRFSPDGRWVSYTSTETGQSEIYIQPFPGPGPKSQVSVGGGTRARWRRDGRELFYVTADDRLMVVPMAQDGSTIRAGTPQPLFVLSTMFDYEVSPDGQRFLTHATISEASPITVILNWKPPAR